MRLRKGATPYLLLGVLTLGTGLGLGLLLSQAPVTRSLSSATLVSDVVAGAARDQLLFRPVLCYAPPYSGTSTGNTASAGLLPATCPSQDLLDSPNLAAGGANSSNSYPNAIDSALSAYPSTTPSQDAKRHNRTVLLPGLPPSNDGLRYLAGPAELTGRIVQSARATLTQTQGWVINMTLTRNGATAWNKMAKQYFHEVIAIEFDGVVQSAPLILPASPTFQSFDGAIELSGSFTRSSAHELVSELTGMSR